MLKLKSKIIYFTLLLVISMLLLGAINVFALSYSGDLVPVMTGNNNPSPLVSSASSEYYDSGKSTFYSFKAFDNDPNTTWASATTILTGWLKIDLGSGRVVKKYSVVGYSFASASPKSWTFEGSNDGTNFVKLDTQTNQIEWLSGQVRSFAINNSNSYRYYRLNISANNGNNGCVEVADLQLFEELTVNSISVTPSSQTLLVGQSNQLSSSATYSDSSINEITSSSLWTSSDSNIAIVDSNGLVTAKAAGTATITAAYEGKTATSTITVEVPVTPVTGFSLNKTSTNLNVGQSEVLVATIIPADATNKSVQWISSNPAVATVDNGTITGIAPGTATITATTIDGSFTATCTVNVSSGSSALLVITMTNGKQKEYDIRMSEVETFISWYDNKSNGTGKSYYKIRKNIKTKPFINRYDYIIFDKILDFEVNEYIE